MNAAPKREEPGSGPKNKVGGPKSKNRSEAAELSKEALASYVSETLISLRQMADARDLGFLSYLLEMAAQEATNVKNGRS